MRAARPARATSARATPARATAVGVALALTLSACSGDPAGSGSATSATTPSSSGTATGTASGTASAPAVTPTVTATFGTSPIEKQLAWMVGQMNSDPVDSNLSTRLSPTFLEAVPAAQWLVMIGQLRAQGPWVVESLQTDGVQGAAVLVGAGQRFRLTMSLDDKGLIAGALLKGTARGETATDWAGVEKRAQLAAPQVSILAVDIAPDGTQTPVHRSGDQGLRPLGSMFKLYVLAAVADQVAAGRLDWERQLTLTAADKTLPSGTLQDEPDGTKITVREAAKQMISISDNTATDLLIRTVGEPAVRASAARAGHRHPASITPFLTAKQMFWLGYDPSAPAQAARREWKDADEARRRDLLAALPMPGPGPKEAGTGPAQWPQGIEWFATPQEIIDVHLYLDRLAGTPAGKPLREILTTNGGIEVPGWSAQAFKGGSDVGVIAMSFLAPLKKPTKGVNRSALVMIGTSTEAVDEETFVAATQDAARLMTK